MKQVKPLQIAPSHPGPQCEVSSVLLSRHKHTRTASGCVQVKTSSNDSAHRHKLGRGELRRPRLCADHA